MTTVLQRVANLLSLNNRYVIGFQREDPTGGLVVFFDPHTLRPDYIGPPIHGSVRFTLRELRDFTPTEVSHRVREAEQELLDRLTEARKIEGRALRTLGVSLTAVLLVIYPISGLFF